MAPITGLGQATIGHHTLVLVGAAAHASGLAGDGGEIGQIGAGAEGAAGAGDDQHPHPLVLAGLATASMKAPSMA